jgi:hypothetical protein
VYDQQPPPPKSNTLKYVAFGCLGLLFVMGCVFGGCMLMGGGAAMTALGATEAPANQAKGFFADLRGRNYAGALARMSPTYQANHPVATFEQSLAAFPALTQQTDDTLSTRSVNGTTATMSGTLTTPTGPVPMEVMLTQNGATWQIDSVMVASTVLQ